MGQTSYSQALTAAVPGQLGGGEPRDILSRASNEASLKIPFGVFVAQDTSDDAGCKLPASATDKMIGVALQRHGASKDLDVSSTGFNPGAMIGVLSKGKVWVTVEEAVVIGDPVFVRFAPDATFTQLGGVRKSVSNYSNLDTARMAFGCVFASTQATIGGLALIDINMNLAQNPTLTATDVTP